MPISVEQLERLARDGRFRPTSFTDGKPNLRRWSADFAGNCQAPVTVELSSRPTWRQFRKLVLPRDGRSMTITMEVPCRRCVNCLARRAAHWRLRALAEWRAAEAVGARTWATTLTIEPAVRQQILDRLRRRIGFKKVGKDLPTLDFDALPPEEQFREKHREISKEITRYMKRVRTNSGSVLRHLVVCERHEGGGALHGEPHYHMLWHETAPDQPVRKNVLVAAWGYGYSNNKLVRDKGAALYLTKYLSKSILARVRASVDYGMSDGLHTLVKRDTNETTNQSVGLTQTKE